MASKDDRPQTLLGLFIIVAICFGICAGRVYWYEDPGFWLAWYAGIAACVIAFGYVVFRLFRGGK